MLRQMGALALLTAVAQASALTPGPVQGRVVIGRPLELVVMAAADDEAPESDYCPQAEVSYGETRLPAAEVSVTGLPSGATGWKVRASLPVNEPLVTLLLKVGCGSVYSRSYLMLADQDELPRATDGLPASRATPKSTPAPEPADVGLQPAPVRLPAARPRPPGIESLPAKSRPRPEPVAATDRPHPSESARAASLPSVPDRIGPRLELELLEQGASTSAVQPGAQATSVSASATGSGGVDMARQQASSGQALARELETLRAEQARTSAIVESLQQQLAESRRPRWQDPLVLALLGLSTASLLALAWSWVRLRRQHWA